MPQVRKSHGPHPDYYFDRVCEISHRWMLDHGLSGLLLDIDNTITRWESHTVPPAELAWLKEVGAAGIRCRLLSNGLPQKKASVVEQTGIPLVSGLIPKPVRAAFRSGLKDLALAPGQVMMIGDSVFTDVIGANRCGIWTCLVNPLSHVDFLGTKVYRFLERVLDLRRPYTREGDHRATRPL